MLISNKITLHLCLQTLMREAAWNVCPVSNMMPKAKCYFAEDQTFANMSGTISTVIEDCPDGNPLHVVRNMFLHNVSEDNPQLYLETPNHIMPPLYIRACV